MADFVISASLALRDNLTAPMQAAIRAIRKLRGEAEDADDSVDKLNRSLQRSNATLGLVTSGFSAATAAIAPLIAGVGALGSSLASAGIGTAAYGVVAKSALKSVFDATEEVAKIQEKIAQADTIKEQIAAQKELSAVYANLSKGQIGAVQELQKFKTFWQGFTQQFEKPIFTAFIEGLRGAKKLLNGLAPTISGVSNVVVNLAKEFNVSMKSAGMKSFFDWLSSNAPRSLSNLSLAFGNAFGGVMNLLRAFSPMSAGVENGLVRIMTRFREWTAGLSQSKGFQAYIEYVKTNAPIVSNILGNVFKVLGSLFKSIVVAQAPLQKMVLTGLEKITGVLKSILIPTFEFIGPVIANTFKMASNAITGAITFIKSNMHLVIPVFNAVVGYGKQVFQTIAQWWQRDGGMIIQAAKNVVNFVISAFQFLTPVWKVIWTVVKTVVIGIWENIKGVISGAIGIITNTISFFSALFTGNWRGMWESIKGLVSSALQFVWNFIQLTFLGRLLGPIRAGMGLIKSTIAVAWDFVKSIFVNTWNFLRGLLSARTSNIVSTLGNGMNFLRDIFWKGWDFIKNIFSNTFSSIWKNVTKTFGDIKKTLGDWVGKAKNLAKDFLQGIIDGWNQKIGDIIAAAKKIWEQIKGVFTDEPITVAPTIRTASPVSGMTNFRRMEGHALGGIFTKPHVAYFAEDGPEAAIPLGSDKRQRGLELYNQVGQILGANNTGNQTINRSNTTNKQVTVNVTYVAGNGDSDTEFRQFMRRFQSVLQNTW
jgi:phage-related protein